MSIVQYVVVRGDLLRQLGWPFGAVIAQACHACTAVLHLYAEDAQTKAYLADLDRMHKVVLEVKLWHLFVRALKNVYCLDCHVFIHPSAPLPRMCVVTCGNYFLSDFEYTHFEVWLLSRRLQMKQV